MNPVRSLSQKKFRLNFFCKAIMGDISNKKSLVKISHVLNKTYF